MNVSSTFMRPSTRRYPLRGERAPPPPAARRSGIQGRREKPRGADECHDRDRTSRSAHADDGPAPGSETHELAPTESSSKPRPPGPRSSPSRTCGIRAAKLAKPKPIAKNTQNNERIAPAKRTSPSAPASTSPPRWSKSISNRSSPTTRATRPACGGLDRHDDSCLTEAFARLAEWANAVRRSTLRTCQSALAAAERILKTPASASPAVFDSERVRPLASFARR